MALFPAAVARHRDELPAYLPMSLKPEAVNRELAVPPDDMLRVRA